MAFPSSTEIEPRWSGTETFSHYVEMRDGVRLAVDFSLPLGLPPNARIPALVAATRYWRSRELRWPFSLFMREPDGARDFFTTRGWALIRVDMRGTGASYGTQPHPWPAKDIEDLEDLAGWIVGQTWSDGKLSAYGNSYQATTAALLCATGHPGVTSALVRFTEYDVYSDIAFPGGVPNEFILRNWSNANSALDANSLPPGTSLVEKLLVRGVKPVPGGDLKVAVHQHRDNGLVEDTLATITFRDDKAPGLGVSLDEVSLMNRPAEKPVDAWGGWFDAATADAVIRRFVETDSPMRGVIGPWNHGGKQHLGAKSSVFPPGAQMLEALSYMNDPCKEKKLHYWTIGEETWKETHVWPPEGCSMQTLCLNAGGMLSDSEAPVATVKMIVDFDMTTGKNNRWQTELDQRQVVYAPLDGRLSFTSAPLDAPLEICGYPKLTVPLSSTHDDGALYAYLEEIDVEGKCHYLTEGMLRLVHRRCMATDDSRSMGTRVARVGPSSIHTFLRKDALPLIPGESNRIVLLIQPISVLVRTGSRLRLSLGGADRDTFARLPAVGNPAMEFTLGKNFSVLEIPVMGRI